MSNRIWDIRNDKLLARAGPRYKKAKAKARRPLSMRKKAAIARQAVIDRWGLPERASYADVVREHEIRSKGRIHVDGNLESIMFCRRILCTELNEGRISRLGLIDEQLEHVPKLAAAHAEDLAESGKRAFNVARI